MMKHATLPLVILAAALAACSGQDQRQAQRDADAQTKTIRTQSADALLTARVATAMAGDAGVNAFKIAPSAHDGVVTLKGAVRTRSIEKTIVDSVKAVPGVTKVVNEIAVR